VFFGYVVKELRRRRRQAVVIALGLAVGVGLVVTVSAMSAGVEDAQRSVLRSLYGIGTDITVTEAADAGQPPTGGFRIGAADVGGRPTKISRDQVVASPGQATFSERRATTIADLDGVDNATGALSLTAIHLSGKLPSFDVGGGPSAQGSADGSAQGSPVAVTPGDVDVESSSITGIEPGTTLGPLATSTVVDGRTLRASDRTAEVAVLDEGYAQQHELAVGDVITIAGTGFDVVGLVAAPVAGAGEDVYVPLVAAQDLAGTRGVVSTVYVEATDASSIDAATTAIEQRFPSATVSTSAELAAQVTGSLASASNLIDTLGRWLSVAALAAAIVLASLLTLAAVGRRVRELGTLKALGWRTRRVVGQVLGESVAQGLMGGAIGVVIGLAGAWVVTQVAPELTADVSTATQGAGPAFAGPVGAAGPLANTISIPLTASVSASLVVAAVVLSIAGGVVAGLVGGWRAARLRPADAMRQVA
jgi:ABC-type antimicrobial peptide transport system permease subunit